MSTEMKIVKGVLKEKNSQLKLYGAKLKIVKEDVGYYGLVIQWKGGTEHFASGYFERELEELVNDAYQHVIDKYND